MLPILFTLGRLKIYTFGVFLVLGFFWGSFLLWKVIRLTAYKEDEVFDGLFWALGGALFFGRLFHVILNFSDFGFDILKFILINGYPGFQLYGGLFGGLLVLWLFLRAKKIKFSEMIDYWMAPLFLTLAFTKLGAFLNTGLVGFLGQSLAFFAGCYLSYRLLMEIRKEKIEKGFSFYSSIWYFAFFTLLFDKMTGSHIYFQGYSVDWLVSFILVLTLTFYFLYYFRSSIFLYGKKSFQAVHHTAKTKIRRGKKENLTAD